MKPNHPARRAIALGAGIVLSTMVLAPSFASAQTVRAQALAPSAASAIDWIEKELTASGHRFQVTSTFEGQTSTFDDIGLTIDALLAIASAGRNTDTEATAVSNYVVAHAKSYAAPGSDRYAGPLGKLMVLAQARGLNTTNVDGLNLENELRGRLQTNGRFTDASEFGDFSNGIGQALDMIALARTPDKIPNTATAWLLAQQCPNGSFRTDYAAGVTCADNADGNADGTSFAVMALKFANLAQADAPKIDKALDYLVGQMVPATGLIGNGNSSGLAAAALRSFGRVPDANKVAAGVAGLQVTAGPDRGAIALNKADKDAAGSAAFAEAKRPVFQRVTPQAVLALGLPSYIDRGTLAPVEPSSTISASAASAKAGDSITVTGGGFKAGETVNGVVESDPVSVGSGIADAAGGVSFTFALPASVPAGSHTLKLSGATSAIVVSVPLTVTAAQVATTTTTVRTTTTVGIVRTGTSSGDQAGFAFLLVGAGVALALIARQRRVIYPFKN